MKPPMFPVVLLSLPLLSQLANTVTPFGEPTNPPIFAPAIVTLPLNTQFVNDAAALCAISPLEFRLLFRISPELLLSASVAVAAVPMSPPLKFWLLPLIIRPLKFEPYITVSPLAL